jgi:5'-nucleotidase (lipoprotein e(P4) family)
VIAGSFPRHQVAIEPAHCALALPAVPDPTPPRLRSLPNLHPGPPTVAMPLEVTKRQLHWQSAVPARDFGASTPRSRPVRLVTSLAPFMLAATALACSSAPRPVPATAPTPALSAAYPTELRWVRTSAEYRALTLQTYRAAGSQLVSASRGLARGSWAVIFDLDETLIDNSEYQKRIGAAHQRYADSTWARWVMEGAATALPGAVELTRKIHALGGLVAVVTNHAESLCAVTRKHLVTVGIQADLVLCQPPGVSDKNPRFRQVESGTAVPGIPPLKVLEWLGDNIQDFPMLTQRARNDPAGLAEFGSRYFVLPNPMYGSWEKNPDQ